METRRKRSSYVLLKPDSDTEEMNFASSDTDEEPVRKKSKVRTTSSIKKLLKESKGFKIDEDHNYTNGIAARNGNPLRKRKITEGSDDQPVKQKCSSKNAIMAKMNRERKKKYIQTLETQNEELKKDNNEFIRKIEDQNKVIAIMRRKILDLQNVLANSREFGQILGKLKQTTGLPVTSSLLSSVGCDISSKNLDETEECGNLNLQEVYSPRTRSSGYSFPILNKDINMGSSSDNSVTDDIGLPDFDSSHFHNSDFPENLDSFLNTDTLSDYIFNSDAILPNLQEEESFFDNSISKDENAGICLHLSKTRISVEVCHICNDKANSSTLVPGNA